MREWIDQLLAFPGMAGMGHGQRARDANLGLGWAYYALARILRPRTAVVIGSYRGFVPMVIARALADNAAGAGDTDPPGIVEFIDPSHVDGFWTNPAEVESHFASLGITNVRHHPCTTEEFVASPRIARITDVGMLFVDGYHTAEQARFDHESFAPRLTADAIVLFHDSIRERTSAVYGEDRVYTHTVVRYIEELRRDARYEVFCIPMADGVTLVRRRDGAEAHP